MFSPNGTDLINIVSPCLIGCNQKKKIKQHKLNLKRPKSKYTHLNVLSNEDIWLNLSRLGIFY